MVDPTTPNAVSKDAVAALQRENAEALLTAFKNGLSSPASLQSMAEAGQKLVDEFQASLTREMQDVAKKKTFGEKVLGGADRAIGGAGKAWGGLQALDYTVSPIMRTGANAVNAINNPNISTDQLDKQLVDMIPVVGSLVGAFRSLRDAVDGTAYAMQRERERNQAALLSESNRASAAAELSPRRQELASARNAASILGGAAPSAYTATDRSTGRGAIDYEIEQRRLAQTDSRDAALRTAAMSGRDVVSARARRDEVDRQLASARRERTTAAAGVRSAMRGGSDVTSSRGTADTVAALNRVEEANARILNLTRERRAADEATTQAEIRNANDLSQVRQRNIDRLREEISILRDRERSQSQSARSIGRATQFDREVAMQFGEIARTQGIQALLPEQRDMLERFAPNFVGGELERTGAQDPAFRYFQDVLGESGSEARGTTLGDTRRQIDRVQAEVRNEIVIDQRALADQIAAALGPALERLIETIRVEAGARTSEMFRGRLITAVTS